MSNLAITFRNIIATLVFLAVVVLATTISSTAQSIIRESGDSYTLGGTVYNQTIYKVSDQINIYGAVNGDIYCFGNEIIIDAIVNGDVICAGNNVTIKGTISGDIRLTANSANIYANVKNNATVLSSYLNIKQNSNINGDLTAFSEDIDINGQIGRDVNIRANSVDLYGKIGRNLKSYHNNLTFNADASVGGEFAYSSTKNVYIPKDSVKKDVIQEPMQNSSRLSMLLTSTVFIAMFVYIAWFISLIIASLGVALAFPKSLQDSVNYVVKQPIITIFVGAMSIVLSPIILILLLFSIVGIPLAVIFGFMYGTVLLLSTPFVAHLMGALLLPKRSHPTKALAGASILLLVFAIPVVNVIAYILVTSLGSGMVIRVMTERYSVARRQYQQKA